MTSTGRGGMLEQVRQPIDQVFEVGDQIDAVQLGVGDQSFVRIVVQDRGQQPVQHRQTRSR